MSMEEQIKRQVTAIGASSSYVEDAEPTRSRYNELPDSISSELDVIEQLKSNINQLEDLHGRMQYMMGELKGLVRK